VHCAQHTATRFGETSQHSTHHTAPATAGFPRLYFQTRWRFAHTVRNGAQGCTWSLRRWTIVRRGCCGTTRGAHRSRCYVGLPRGSQRVYRQILSGAKAGLRQYRSNPVRSSALVRVLV
jgi:hypothetical protein